MRPEFDDLRERLLRGGVRPALARRYVAELSDHYEDLLETETPEAALRRLGSSEPLAAAMLAQPGVRSWTARAPWATLTLAPLMALVAASVLPALLLFLAVRAFAADLDYGHAALPGTWPYKVLDLLYAFNEHLLPILVGWGFVTLAWRQRAGVGWLCSGAALTALVGGGLFLMIDWNVGYPANVRFGVGLQFAPIFTTVWGRSLERGVVNLLIILLPYAVLRCGRRGSSYSA